MDIHYFKQALTELVDAGGPTVDQYDQVVLFIAETVQAIAIGQLLREDVRAVLESFGEVFSVATIQGRGLQKPYGYAGDFEMMDCIYLQHVSPNPHLANWDRFFHWNHAPKAVRNRKQYFHGILDSLPKDGSTVLKLGVGPGRSMYEWLTRNPFAKIEIECVDVDPRSIGYAQQLNSQNSNRIKYYTSNIFKFTPPKDYRSKYNLIWAAGLFDYFDDEVFVRMASRFMNNLAPDGEMVIGNFAETNPSRPYMELFGEWYLHHRTPEKLYALGAAICQNQGSVQVGKEPEGVNLFLHIKKRA